MNINQFYFCNYTINMSLALLKKKNDVKQRLYGKQFLTQKNAPLYSSSSSGVLYRKRICCADTVKPQGTRDERETLFRLEKKVTDCGTQGKDPSHHNCQTVQHVDVLDNEQYSKYKKLCLDNDPVYVGSHCAY